MIRKITNAKIFLHILRLKLMVTQMVKLHIGKELFKLFAKGNNINIFCALDLIDIGV